MDANGEPEEPELTAGLEGFLEGLERKVTGEDDSFGIVHSAEAAREMDGVPDPPEHMARPVWDVVGVWKDAARMSGGIIILASDGSPVRDSSPPDKLDEEAVISIHSD